MSVLVPVLEYGSEVWTAGKKEVEELDKIVLKAAKYAIGCGKCTSHTAVKGEMGLHSMATRIDAKKLAFRGQVQGFGEDRLPKHVLGLEWTTRVRGGPALWDTVTQRLADTYGMQVDTLEDLTLDIIRDAVQTREQDAHSKNVRLTPSIRVLAEVNDSLEPQAYLSGKWSAGMLAKFLMRTGGFGAKGIRGRRSNVTVCPICKARFECSQEHLLTQCVGTEEVRQELAGSLQRLSADEFEKWLQLPNYQRVIALLKDDYWSDNVRVRVDGAVKHACLQLWNLWKANGGDGRATASVPVVAGAGATTNRVPLVAGAPTPAQSLASAPAPASALASALASSSASRRGVNGRIDYDGV